MMVGPSEFKTKSHKILQQNFGSKQPTWADGKILSEGF